jgi:4-alpha-glucanotransferase
LPVEPAEFLARGIPFDRPRLTHPYINDEVLLDTFGADYSQAKQQFFDEDRFGRVTLKPEVSTQKQVQELFASKTADDQSRRIQQGLFDIIANVVLLEEKRDSEDFHFRFDMAATSSFQGLKPETRHRIKELYVDYFFRRQERCWAKEGLEKLPALQRATRLLICGEDLGLVPACVPQIMEQLGLLSLEVQRMPKALGQTFSRPSLAPYLSVVTPGTHDMSSLREWWKEDPALTEKFFREELGGTGSPPPECTPELVQQILRQHVQSPAMWAIFQIQDLLGANAALRRTDGLSERINVPANPRHYWRYRMHVDLEDLPRADGFRQQLVSLLAESGRIHHPAGR